MFYVLTYYFHIDKSYQDLAESLSLAMNFNAWEQVKMENVFYCFCLERWKMTSFSPDMKCNVKYLAMMTPFLPEAKKHLLWYVARRLCL